METPALPAPKPVDEALSVVAQHACVLTGADYATLGLTDQLTRAWRGTWGVRSHAWQEAHDLGPSGLAQRALTKGAPVAVAQLRAAEGYPQDFALHADEGAATVVAVPIIVGRRPAAVLEAGWRTETPITAETLQRLHSVARFGGVIIDAARTQAETAAHAADLAASEQRFRLLYETIACGVMVKNRRGEVIEANGAAQQIFGLTLGEMLGKRTETLWRAFDEDGVELEADDRPSMLALRTREPARGFVMRIALRDGSDRWLQVDAVPVLDADGSVRQIVSSFIDITERKQVEEALRRSEAALEHQALHDGLTGLANRTLLHDRLRHAIQRGKRESQPAALLFLDLNGFKDVNDNFGHEVGDEVLRELAARMQAQLRESDTIARMGGDEFAIVLPGVGDETAASVAAAKLLAAVEQPVETAAHTLQLSAAIGIALFPKHGTDSKALMRKADVAMYEAKRTGSPMGTYRTAKFRKIAD